MLLTSATVGFLEYFRVPYRSDADIPQDGHRLPGLPAGLGLLRLTSESGPASGSTPSPSVYFVVSSDGGDGRELPGLRRPERFFLEGIPLFGRLLDRTMWWPPRGSSWQPWLPLHDGHGRPVADIWRHDDGSVLLPFSADAVISNLTTEAYRRPRTATGSAALSRVARWLYYRVRPLMPRRLQIRLRRWFTRVQSLAAFPRWPIEPALHDFQEYLLDLLGCVLAQPIPTLGSWPAPYTWALVLTHDVETSDGYRTLSNLLEIEQDLGYHSAWNFVGGRYDVDDETIAGLKAIGCEVGVHGLFHDGRDLAGPEILRQRLPAMERFADRWGATGFRAPAMQRDWQLMTLLPFEYDSSYPDTDPYQPISGGCCSWLPIRNGHLVELPLTMAQDFVLFDLLRLADESEWLKKALYLRSRGGLATMLTHPDYMQSPERTGAYRRFLSRFADDDEAWKVLPQEIASWWRKREASWLEKDGGEWKVVGPAATDGRVVLYPRGGGLSASVPAVLQLDATQGQAPSY